MNRQRAAELTGDLAVMTACSALTHVTTSSRASAIFVSRDAHASTGYSDVTHVHHHQHRSRIRYLSKTNSRILTNFPKLKKFVKFVQN